MQHRLVVHPVLVHVGTKLGAVVLQHCHSLIVNILTVECAVAALVVIVRRVVYNTRVWHPRRFLRRYKPVPVGGTHVNVSVQYLVAHPLPLVRRVLRPALASCSMAWCCSCLIASL